MSDSAARRVPVAVVGLAALLPGSEDVGRFWRHVVAGRDLLTDVPPTHWRVEDYYDADPAAPDRTYCRRGGFLPEVQFDPREFGIPPTSLPATDTAQLLSLLVARALIDDTVADPAKLPRNRVSVILGATGALEAVSPLTARIQRPTWARAMREQGIAEPDIDAVCGRIAASYVPWQEASFPGLLQNVISGRIANRFDLHGTNMTTDAACASSLSAVGVAMNELALGQADLVIAGGVDAENDIFAFLCFSKTPALSPTGDCRPFSDAADGTMLGEGIAMFALKRLADAERDGDRIYAVLRGLGSSSDGRHKSIYAPRAEGQALALKRCYESAGYGPETVQLLEAHGTATRAGDVAEVEALHAVFGSGAGPRSCALGSVKSQIGHTKGAAGAAGLLKVVLALHERVLPPTIKVERPDPALGLENGPFYLNTVARPWVKTGARPRRASVSSFGFGGTNYHLAVEEYLPPSGVPGPRRFRSSPTELLLLHAGTRAELAARLASLRGEADLQRAARESQLAFQPEAPLRLAIVAEEDQLDSALARAEAALASGDATVPGPGLSLREGESAAGGIAFLFPGQGSQYLGMGADLAIGLDAALRVWDAAPSFDGVGPHDVAFPPPVFTDAARAAHEARLSATEWAQPAIGAASLATLAVLRELGLTPTCVAGHSFGELTALYAAGALGAGDVLRLARRRGELMRDAARRSPGGAGGMLAVPRPAAEVRALVSSAAGDAADSAGLVVANENAPLECVVSGGLEAIAAFAEALARQGIEARRLPVSAAFHSPAVAPAVPALAAFLEGLEVGPPVVDVYGNADAAPYPNDPAAVREALARQLERPVRFLEIVEAMYARGVRTFVEVGPSAVLTGLVGRILGDRPHLAVETDRRGRHGLTSLQHALGRLSAAGIALDYRPHWRDLPGRSPQPRRAGAEAVRINGANFGKPVPKEAPPPRPAPAVATPGGVGGRSDSRAPSWPAETDAGRTAWIAAYQDVQRQTADAHAAFQKAMADTHAEFLRVAEASIQGLSSYMSGSPVPLPIPPLPLPAPPAVAPGLPPRPAPPSLPAPLQLPLPPPPPLPSVFTPPEVTDAPRQPRPATADLVSLLLGVVAEKTGYQEASLGMDMDLEADLGIDSIKRVEILAAVRDRAPWLPEVTPAEIATLRTLGEVREHLTRERAPAEVAAPVAPLAAPEGGAIPAASGAEPPLLRQTVRLVPEAPCGLALAGLYSGGRMVVTEDGGGVSAALVRELAARGVNAESAAEVPSDADAVIDLSGLREVDSVEAAVAVNRAAFGAARAVAARFGSGPHVYVTVQDTGGDFGHSGREPLRAWLGGAAALARGLTREWLEASVKAIDVARGGRSPEAIARAIAGELLEGGGSRDVGLDAGGARVVRRRQASPRAAGGESILGPASVVVASGGARGVTAAALTELARASRARIALFGRTAMADEPPSCRGAAGEAEVRRALQAAAEAAGTPLAPARVREEATAILANREIRATLQALREAGSEAIYLEADVRDPDSVTRALGEVRARWGAITALVHGAGVLADKRLEDKTAEQFDRVFDTKVGGLSALLSATAEDPLEWICLFSSIAAQGANPGQSDYAMANEVLNQVASAEAFRRRGRCAVRSIGWGPWRGGMVGSGLARMFEENGFQLIPIEAGARAFVAEASREASDPVVLLGDVPAFPAAERTLEVRVDAVSHPQLLDHAVGGTAVLPVAFAVEWFLRAAREARPDLVVTRLVDVRVRRGIRLERLADGERFLVRCREDGPSSLRLELCRAAGPAHYTATAELAGELPERPAVSADPSPLVEFNGARIYDGLVLFHGPRFQVIRSLHSLSPEGAVATMVGLSECGWPQERWQTDPAALDGALQLTGACGARALGGATLPMGVAEVAFYHPGQLPASLRGVLWARDRKSSRLVSDVALSDAGGRVLLALRGIDSILRPDVTSLEG